MDPCRQTLSGGDVGGRFTYHPTGVQLRVLGLDLGQNAAMSAAALESAARTRLMALGGGETDT